MVDGLKPSQRKIIYACIKKDLTSEIKVSQLSGYVSEKTSYHHGETSLMDTIINLAQNFVGSNNINLLKPVGQFGTRLQGGKDSASPRYIFTQLSETFHKLFNKEDFDLLEYLDDDGFSIEPKFYVPTLPLILINGACGIGTGFSSDVPCFNPEDIKDRLMKLVEDEDADIEELTPWYNGFTGKIEKVEENKWITTGVYTVETGKVKITELPVGTWTDDYKAFLDKLETEDLIYSYKNSSTENTVNFEITIPKKTLEYWISENSLEKKLKLTSYISAKNMHVFNEKNQIVKMESAEEILFHFWRIRNDYYLKRKKNITEKLSENLNVINSKIKFVTEIIEDKLIVFRKTLDFINKQLDKGKYHKVNGEYKYLTSMQIHSFSSDTIEELTKKQSELNKKYNKILSMKLEDFWKEDLY
jgi:DNA topoisomerase-2